MEAVSYTNFRQNMANVLDHVNDDSVPVQITRKGKRPAVVVSMDDWESLQETLYVLQNKHLMRQINVAEQVRAEGKAAVSPDQDTMNEILGV